MIKVSVILPVYNVQDYLRECLDCLINQTLKEIEIICVNDFSTDQSLDILNEYAQIDNRITILNNEANLGAAYSRNVGIKFAKGEYLSIFDADDFYDVFLLEKVYLKCVREKADLGIYDYATYNNTSQKTNNIVLSLHFYNQVKDDPFQLNQIKDSVFQMWTCSPCTKMYRRNFIIESGIEFQNLKNANDTYFGNMVIALADKVVYIDSEKPLYYYRINVSTQTSRNRHKAPTCIWEATVLIRNSLIEKGIFDLCNQSFHSYAVSNLIYSLSFVEGEQKKSLQQFFSNDGLKKLGMLNCKETDFISQYDYTRYKLLQSGHNSMINSCENMYIGHSRAIALFTFLKNKKYTFGLWGIGQFGTAFLNGCKQYGLNIECLIDEDEMKVGTQFEHYQIENFDNVMTHINAVIITNTRYSRSVYKIIKEKKRDIKLIDVDAYYRLGIDIEECIY